MLSGQVLLQNRKPYPEESKLWEMWFRAGKMGLGFSIAWPGTVLCLDDPHQASWTNAANWQVISGLGRGGVMHLWGADFRTVVASLPLLHKLYIQASIMSPGQVCICVGSQMAKSEFINEHELKNSYKGLQDIKEGGLA